MINNSDLLQLSGMAQSHAACVANILADLKSQISLKSTQDDDVSFLLLFLYCYYYYCLSYRFVIIVGEEREYDFHHQLNFFHH